jgi:predicted metalloprotease
MPRTTARRSPVLTALAVCCLLVLAGCSTVTNGNGSPQRAQLAPDASSSSLPIKDDGHTSFDQLVRNSLTDVEEFWGAAYPSLSGGSPLKSLAGGVYSVETGKPDVANACMKAQPKAADNNAFYCRLDDTFAYDRVGLVKIIADKLGQNFVPLVFAHEFGHLIQNRLDKSEHPSIYLESQADCASGAFMAAESGVGTVQLKNIHFSISPTNLDALMVGMILLRDYSPHSATDSGTHGDGFDRISAFSDGFSNGVKYCYSDDWYSRKFTERSYADDKDYQAGGNETLAEVTNPTATAGAGGGGLQPSLNAFWTRAFKTINKTFKPVTVKQADNPPCGPKGSEFNYCASDNTVYFSSDFASAAYYSVPVLVQDPATKIVSIKQNSAADYALGAMFAYGWGLAVRSQLSLSTSTAAGLLGASCYVGAYSKTINNSAVTGFALSPPDMDEATVTVLRIVGQNTALGDRNTTGFQRISAFKKGYFGSLTAC